MSIISKLQSLRKNILVQSIGIYTGTNFFSKGVSFLLLFIYTNPKYINPSENGLLSLMSTSISFLMPFISMGVLQSVSTDFFKLEKKEFKDLFTTSFLFPVVGSMVAVVVLFILRDYLYTNYKFPGIFVFIIPAIVFFTFCYEQLINIIRNNNEPMRFLGTNLTKTFTEIGLSVVLVVFFAWRWEGRVAGIVLSYAVITAYAFYYFYKKDYLFGSIKKKYIFSELKYALPIITMQASIFAMSSSDKFFLSKFTSDNNATVGIYSVVCIFGSVITILSTAMLQYIFPKIYSTLSAPEIDKASLKKHFYLYLAVMAVGTACVMIATPLLFKYFINSKYHVGIKYIYLLGTGYFLWAIAYYFYSFLFYNKLKTKIFILSAGSIIISLVCNYYFIKNWTALGAAISVCVSYFGILVLTLLVIWRYIKLYFLG